MKSDECVYQSVGRMKKVLTTYWLLAISGKRGRVADHRKERRLINQKSEPKKKVPGRVLFAHDTF